MGADVQPALRHCSMRRFSSMGSTTPAHPPNRDDLLGLSASVEKQHLRNGKVVHNIEYSRHTAQRQNVLLL